MCDERQQRAVLFVDRLPVRAVHLRVVEELALDAPRLAEDLRPLDARIDQRLERADIDGAVTDVRRPVGGDDAPAVAVGAIEQLLRVGRERVRANALEERRRLCAPELITMDDQRALPARAAFPCRRASRRCRARARCNRRRARRAPGCADRCPRDRCGPPWTAAFGSAGGLAPARRRPRRVRRRRDGLVAGFGQERRRLARAQHRQIDRARDRAIQRAHLEPAGPQRVVRAREEVEILAARRRTPVRWRRTGRR